MTEIIKGLPKIKERNSTNGMFAKGREVAEAVLAAGPGHHAERSFHVEKGDVGQGFSEMGAFQGGAKAFSTKNGGKLTVVRRLQPAGETTIYVINKGGKTNT